MFFLFYNEEPIDLTYNTNKLVPPDSIWGIIYMNIGMLLTMTAFALSIFVLVSNTIYMVYTLFK